MDKELPTWLNNEFLEAVLKEGDESRQVKVNSFSAKLALPPGDNFTSHIFRVKIDYTVNSGPNEEISVMVKAPIMTGLFKEMQKGSGGMNLFEAEPRVYKELLPRLKKKVNLDFGPKLFPCPTNGLVMKDLKEDGFILMDRLQQLDFAHCKLALTTVAKYHAASVKIHREEPEFIEDIGQERMYKAMFLEEWKLWFPKATVTVGNIIKAYEGCEQAGNFVLDGAETVLESMSELANTRKFRLNVMCHGDFWMSNMLFKHDDSGKVVDVKFIDFQVPRFNSPALDVLYFIFTSANEEARSKQRDLLDAYLQTFNSTLETLDCDERLSSEEFDEELRRYKLWGVVAMCNVLPLVLCDPMNVLNMDDFSMEDFKMDETFDKYAVLYRSKRLVEELPKVAKHLQKEFLS